MTIPMSTMVIITSSRVKPRSSLRAALVFGVDTCTFLLSAHPQKNFNRPAAQANLLQKFPRPDAGTVRLSDGDALVVSCGPKALVGSPGAGGSILNTTRFPGLCEAAWKLG